MNCKNDFKVIQTLSDRHVDLAILYTKHTCSNHITHSTRECYKNSLELHHEIEVKDKQKLRT